jgi:hypothetical protein
MSAEPTRPSRGFASTAGVPGPAMVLAGSCCHARRSRRRALRRPQRSCHPGCCGCWCARWRPMPPSRVPGPAPRLRAPRLRARVLAAGDGALGFWGALREVFPETREQRGWFHKTANVLAALPKSPSTAALGGLDRDREIPPRPGRSRWSPRSPRHRSRMRQAWGCSPRKTYPLPARSSPAKRRPRYRWATPAPPQRVASV